MFMIVVFMIVIMRVRVRDFAMRMFVGVRCAWRRQHLVGMVGMMPVVMGMLVRVCDRTMRMCMTVGGHPNLLCRFKRKTSMGTA